jgi:hypothetical protein
MARFPSVRAASTIKRVDGLNLKLILEPIKKASKLAPGLDSTGAELNVAAGASGDVSMVALLVITVFSEAITVWRCVGL